MTDAELRNRDVDPAEQRTPTSASKLIERLKAYGADISGIQSRFMGDDELYVQCVLTLFEDTNLSKLRDAISFKQYDKAFDAAHALKGATGNLGLTPLHQRLCVLVESLRTKKYDNIDAEYEAVRRELMLAQALSQEEPNMPEPSGEKRYFQRLKRASSKKPPKTKLTLGRLIAITLITLILVVFFVNMLFSNLTNNFSHNVSVESSSHLEEINHQIKLNIEDSIEKDWQIAYSIRSTLAHGASNNDQKKILDFLSEEKDVWKLDEVIVYTEDGVGMRTGGELVANDIASSTMYNANRLGEYLSFVQSTIIYTLPVTSELILNNERITAISIERNLRSFLDGMEFSSFDGTAYIYLTQSGGRIVSQLSVEGAAQTFNISSEFANGELSCLTDPALSGDAMFTSGKPLCYLLTRGASTDYVVVTPVETRHNDMHLVYMVSDRIVNLTMNNFSKNITALSTGILFALAFGILAVFLILYRMRKKQFDQAIISRERTFDLLVANTDTAFALLSTRQKEPIYLSTNARHIVGAPFVSLLRTESGYRVEGSDGKDSETLRRVNQELAKWDGKSMFNSGYLARTEAADTGYYEVQLYPVAESEDEYVAVIQDVTQQFHREDAVINALAMAERSNAAKSRFLSNMSHDIRTPMNAIVNMTQFAKENKDNPALLDEYLDTISESSDHLLQLINDVLDMSRIESGQAVVESEPFNIKSELNRIADIIRPLCQSRRQSLRIDFDSLRADSVLGDQVKVGQVLMNLLSNAVKFTPEGGEIDFTAMEIPSLRAGIAAIRFSVRDNGVGIPEESLKNIFKAFVRVDDKRTSKIEGTGLGLSICQSYVNAMGGKLSCESEVGKGSVFTVELFFEETDVKLTEEASPVWLEGTPFLGKRCLLCEDNRINQMIARKLLERAGFEVDIAADGLEGVKRFVQSDAGYYDVVYMDIRMPYMDGYEVTAEIRKSAHPQAKTIPIIAMTANVFAEDVEKARISGMNGHLGKPINPTELIVETDKTLNKTERSQ